MIAILPEGTYCRCSFLKTFPHLGHCAELHSQVRPQ